MIRPRTVLLDRDGTIIVDRHYLSDPAGVELLPGAVSGLARMASLGLGLVVVTNQSAIGRGFFGIARLHEIHQRMEALLGQNNIRLDGIYFCPHTPDANCSCRKPRTGLVKRASGDLGFDPRESFVVGDKECDVQLGDQLGAITCLVRSGYGMKTLSNGAVAPQLVVADLAEAAAEIEARLQSCKSRPTKTE
jgi:D-glycero-D-manno-heptose 1,7-bisphosphate phosphatase